MRCKQFQRKISPLIDGEVDVSTASAIERHEEQCPECRNVHEKLVALRTCFRMETDTPLPEGFTDTVMCEVRAKSQTKADTTFGLRQWWFELAFPARAGIAVTALLAMCVGAYMGTGVTSDDGSPKNETLSVLADVAEWMVQPLGTGAETPAGAYLALTSISERSR